MLLQDQITYELKSISCSAPVSRVTSLEETPVRRKITRWQRAGLRMNGQQTQGTSDIGSVS